MAEQMTVLQLVLDQLQVGNDISTIDDRIAIQKVVCLTQEAGLPLGYSFSWYVRGPYSPALASDYYQIADAKSSVEASARRFVLTPSALNAVGKVAAVLKVPDDVPLARVYWLELLASIVFLVKRHRLSRAAAGGKIALSKPLLHPYFDRAWHSLQSAGFSLE